MAEAGDAAGIAVELAPQIDPVRPRVISVLASSALAVEKITLVALQPGAVAAHAQAAVKVLV